MIRQDIRIGTNLTSYKFIVDLYKHNVDLSETYATRFVMIRKYNLINNLVYDSDVYLIEKSLFDQGHVIYPYTNGNYVGFSVNASDFSNSVIDNDVVGSQELYDIYNKDGQITNIPCDKIRIYHPHNKTEIDAVVYIDSYIRNTHFHLLCRPYSSYTTHSETAFEDEHMQYSEFIEMYVPNIEALFSGEFYYREDLSSIKCNEYVYEDKDTGYTYASFALYTMPFKIEHIGIDKEKKIEVEEFIKDYGYVDTDNVAHDYVTYPLRVTLFPYSNVDETTGIYLADPNLSENSDLFQEECGMILAARIGFDDNGTPSVIATFNFPSRQLFKNFADAYQHYYGVKLEDYTGIFEYDEDNDDDDDYVEQKQCGFILDIYSNFAMTQRIAQLTYALDDPTKLNDFAIHIDGIFSRWEQLPDTVVMQCTFVDRYLGNILRSNAVTVTEETFKYFINHDDRSVVRWEGVNPTYKTFSDMNITDCTFIDKITCNIIKKADDTTEAPSTQRTPRVMYKPVFYRTQDLQNITIRAGVTQNIGINVAEYMTKVETFKLTIGGLQIVESARNDVYVIFAVNPQTLEDGVTGTYHVSNQDDEYISSGTYRVVN